MTPRGRPPARRHTEPPMLRPAHFLILVLVSGVLCAQAQTGGSAPASGTGAQNGTAPGSTNPSPSSSTGGANGVTVSSPPITGSGGGGNSRLIFLSGIVMMDDGSALPGFVDIDSICGAYRRSMGRATLDGKFGFRWSNVSSAFGDASQVVRLSGGGGASALTGSRNGSRGQDPLANCDLVADYPGYSSARVSLFDRDGQENYDVGAIVLHRIASGEGYTVSALALKAPRDAKKSFEKGESLAAARKLAGAAASFEKAVAIYPDYADAWLSLGRVQWEMLQKDAARASFRKAMKLDDRLVGPWQELGFLACDDSQWEDAARYLDQAVRLDPMDSPNAWYFNALANYNLGRYQLAERSIRAEIKLDRGRNPREDFLLGLILIARHDPEGGAEALRNYIATAPRSEDVSAARRQLSQLESRLRQ